jgi:hypothetical protein
MEAAAFTGSGRKREGEREKERGRERERERESLAPRCVGCFVKSKPRFSS